MGKRTTLTIAAFAWLMGSLLSLPNLLYFTTYWQTMRDSGYRIVCYMEWPDGATSTSMLENVYVSDMRSCFAAGRSLVLSIINPILLHVNSHANILHTEMPTTHRSYNIAFMFLTYILPIGAMVYAYTRVGIELWGSQSIGECSQRQLDNIQSKRRVSTLHNCIVSTGTNFGRLLRNVRRW